MTSHTTKGFRRLFRGLPLEVQETATKAYRLWRKDPYHKALHFKQVHAARPVYSIRVGLAWRAIGVLSDETMI